MNFIEATYILRSKKDKGPDYINRFLESISIFNGKNLTDKKYLPQLVETDIFYDESRKIYEYIFKIGFPIVLFEHNISSIISILRKVTAHSGEDEIVIVNIDIPSCYTDHFSGPKYGTDRIKRILEIEHEPVIAGHIFPFVGVGPEVYVDLFEKLAVNGVDIVIEDTSFIDDRLIPFDKRVELCLKKAEQIEKDTGRKIIYIPVLTGSVGEVFEKARFAESIGIHGFHIDIDPYGMEFLRSLSDGTEGILAVSGSVFSNRYLEGQVFVKLLRLSGADILNIPSPFNENRYTLSRVYELIREATDRWENIKPVFPMLSGYTKPSDIPDIYREFGNQVIINIEESYYNHPEGLQAGVRAFREALDCVIKGISLDECRKKSRDLDLALSKWGSH
ncbi:MAG TPA: hypothetical protein DEP48_07475 [Persephonella sp.]|uniref:Putative ribulose bisphosphate carboxylase (RuBisCO) n=1 Tax=Persephonella marina (strain DSM 14350 / EX-H1) TaxID=123214 RepID=C0QU33_PERMH|nr:MULTISPECIES: RuBisCO large subunit C-terminal-like domain-containing protein [Persephonella]ACO03842.1 putative ribulose bisphosphate carboxylase (RuBisCO) [Persephonella marina EX-H1]HCB70185.1 hypothetical protein [Persephonella sp.]